MNKFGGFIEYLELYESGRLWRDHTYRNYDLLWLGGSGRLRRALADCGFHGSELSVSLAECVTRVRERGYELSGATVQQCLLEWYVWRRIESGEYKKWKWNDQG